MKLKSTLCAAILMIFAASTATAFAVEEQPADAKIEKAEAKKPMKKHSHAAEKTGVPMAEATGGKSHRETMDKDMPMHDHAKERR